MADWDDVRRIVERLPGTDEGDSRGTKAWRVRKKLVVWERPLRKADLEGPLRPPSGHTSQLYV